MLSRLGVSFNRFASISMSPNAYSAHPTLARRRSVSTLMPRAAQAWVSMLRNTVPYFCTTFN